MLPLSRDHRRVVEGKLTGRQGPHRFAGQGPQVLRHAPGLALVGADHHNGPLLLLPDPRRNMGPVDRGQPGKRRRAGCAVDGRRQTAEFLQRRDNGDQLLHGSYLK